MDRLASGIDLLVEPPEDNRTLYTKAIAKRFWLMSCNSKVCFNACPAFPMT
ncbi:hypothetical protein [Picosynechococcus sp. PCC 11901]|uniref:hypothetical protein n=1 Tax=Picosynechococcus sp. PCC 11901 TaxID=2579791 RepID=UPI00143DA108|nr:hypothetical protein [Picosynechococcus sp. PCC 11901]